MKQIKRLWGLLLASAMLLSLNIPAFAAVEDTGFSDVAADAWYAEAVKYCRENSLMSGIGNDQFAPESSLTRAQLAMVLWQLEGQPVVNYLLQFTDVEPAAWYTEAVRWAASEQLVSGYGNGLFGTNDPVTREQMTAIFWRYAGSPATTEGVSFSDAASAASYAASALAWASATGTVIPVSGTVFAPTQNATRAQVASTLMNYMRTQSSVPTEENRVLVAYFSRAGENYGVGVVEKVNTEIVAEMIAEQTGGDLYPTTTPVDNFHFLIPLLKLSRRALL